MPGQVLVWGATPGDSKPLFATTIFSGPGGGEFRFAVRDAIRARLAGEGLEVCFSEDGDRHGHHAENPGFFEPCQLREARMVLLLLPGNRAMAVNTWELALACETEPSTRAPLHMSKIAFVVPQTLFQYLRTVMKKGVRDPADFRWPRPEEEPILGAQNSFAARWIYRIAPDRFAGAKDSGNPADVLPITYYDDSTEWALGSTAGNELLGKIANFVVAHLPA